MSHKTLRVLCVMVLLIVPVLTVRADDRSEPEESWDAIYMGKDKVGYMHTVLRNLDEDGQEVVHVKTETFMSMKRFGQTIEMQMDYNSYETPDGNMLRMDNRALDQRVRGEVKGDRLILTLDTPGKQTKKEIPWSDEVLGPNAQDMILRKEGVKPGEKRSFRTFLPDLNQIVTTTLHGEDMEEVPMLDGTKRSLQRIRMEVEGLPFLKTFAWVDDTGDGIKTHTDMLGGMTTYRVAKDVAMTKPGTISKDFGLSTLIKTKKKITKPYDTAEVVYRIELTGEDPKEVFPQDERQSLSVGDDGQVLLTVRSLDPAKPAADPPGEVSEEFLSANNFLQADDERVIEAAKRAVGDATDPLEKARRIEKWVFQNVAEKNFSKAFDSAAVVAENLEGDCTEHAVLLAAMARVAEVPSRVVMGLVYADRLGVFGYHMWSELHINGHWVPMDGTLGLGHASPAHIKLADSSLDGVEAMATFLPVARVLDRLKIEVVRYEPAASASEE